MFKYLFKRAVTYLVMTFITASVAFILAASTMNPGLQEEQKVPRPSPESIRNTLRVRGLDPERPVMLRYFDWLKGIFTRWDWGFSPDGSRVNDEFARRMWISLALFIASAILTIVIGIALGVYTASRQYSVGDRIVTGWSYLTFILPIPVAYLLVQLLFISLNDVIPGRPFYVTDIRDITVTGTWPVILDYIKHYVVPTTAMTVFGWAGYQVGQRQYLLDNINADFVRTARATGLTRSQAIRRHALRVSFIPTAQSIAYRIPALFVGGYFTESIFNWPGLGSWSIMAIGRQDVNAAAATVAFSAIVFAIGAILADFAITIVDPRVRFQ